jgi:hypothetical protein
VVGLTADGENVAAKDATVRIQVWDDQGVMVATDPANFGAVSGPDFCRCMSHLANLHCTRTYVTGPTRQNLVLKVLSSGQEVGDCPVSLARHNYCGVDITSVDIRIDSDNHVTCGAPARFNHCP